eukprot:EG_transcript_18327
MAPKPGISPSPAEVSVGRGGGGGAPVLGSARQDAPTNKSRPIMNGIPSSLAPIPKPPTAAAVHPLADSVPLCLCIALRGALLSAPEVGRQPRRLACAHRGRVAARPVL